ncbi:NADPH-dependent FMN reductase family protein [Mycobacterium intracellulare]|nr:NADPH-dependent FMN reductase family protein [Mycobacterium intracellulare]
MGSLRAASINRQIAELAAAVASDGVSVTLFEGLADLPFYNEEIDDAMNADAPPLAPVAALRAAAADADAALVVTPEYNGSIPAVVKNAIDWLSRPFGDGALKGKPLAVIGGSFGQYGGCGRTTRPASPSASPVRGSSIRSNCPCRSRRWKAGRPPSMPSCRRTCATWWASSPPKPADWRKSTSRPGGDQRGCRRRIAKAASTVWRLC